MRSTVFLVGVLKTNTLHPFRAMSSLAALLGARAKLSSVQKCLPKAWLDGEESLLKCNESGGHWGPLLCCLLQIIFISGIFNEIFIKENKPSQLHSNLQLPKPIWPNLLRELCGGCLFVSYNGPSPSVATFDQLHDSLPDLKMN